MDIGQTENNLTVPSVASQKGTGMWSVFFVGLSMLLLGFLGGYFFVQYKNSATAPKEALQGSPTPIITTTPSDNTITSGMKTYAYYGISFKYPGTWKAVDPFPGSTNSPAFIGLLPVTRQLNNMAPPIFVESYVNPNNLSLKDYDTAANSTSALAKEFYSPIATVSTIDGFTTYTKEKAGCEPFYCTKVTIMAGNMIYIFYNLQLSGYSDSELAVNKEVFDKVISSITFEGKR